MDAWRDHRAPLHTTKAAKARNSLLSFPTKPLTQPLDATGLQEVLPKPRAWGDAQGTQPHAGVQRGHQQHRQLGSAESLGLIALSPLPTAPWLPTSRRDVLLCIMLVLRILLTSYITGECAQLPFAGSTRASPIQSTSINSNKDHLISRRQLVSSEVRLLC